MAETDQATQTYAAMFLGYGRASERFETAVKAKVAVDAFLPLFEALNWAVALDDRTAKRWGPDGEVLGWQWRERVPGAEVMGGVRFARNRVHHQWSDALRLDESGRQYPRSYPLVYFEWVWRPADQLPKGRPDACGEGVYRRELEGRAARATLAQLGEAFAFLRRVLEPHSLRRNGLVSPPAGAEELDWPPAMDTPGSSASQGQVKP